MKTFISLCFLLIAQSVFSQGEAELIDGKTHEQIVREYQRWSFVKNDYSWIKYFQTSNAELGPVAAGEKRVVFMGDSITQSWSDASPEFFKGKTYVERGISGQTTDQMLIRFRQDVVDLNPAVVVILAGTNDLAQNNGPASNEMIINNFKSMAEIASANGIKVIMSSIMPVEDYPWRPGLGPTQRIIDINTWMKSYAEEQGHVYLDYFTALVNERDGMQGRYSTDGVHANKEGYAVMEALVEDAIAEALSN